MRVPQIGKKIEPKLCTRTYFSSVGRHRTISCRRREGVDGPHKGACRRPESEGRTLRQERAQRHQVPYLSRPVARRRSRSFAGSLFRLVWCFVPSQGTRGGTLYYSISNSAHDPYRHTWPNSYRTTQFNGRRLRNCFPSYRWEYVFFRLSIFSSKKTIYIFV
jgi:hypothetical protein